MNKVFGIGFQKTGTTSLRDALIMLGYRVCDGCGNAVNPRIRELVYKICYKLVDQYDAFEDHPWSVLYKELDCKYPNSKFILTIRPTDQWIKSIRSHFGRTYIPLHEWIYGAGYPEGNEDVYINRYEQHNANVLEYFKYRPNDLLVLSLDGSMSSNELWERLCLFLGRPVPNEEFPCSNRKIDRLMINHLRRIKHRIYGKQPINFFGLKIGKNLSNK